MKRNDEQLSDETIKFREWLAENNFNYPAKEWMEEDLFARFQRESINPLDETEASILKKYFTKIGAKGGKKSKRTLTTKQARAMVKAREAKRKSG